MSPELDAALVELVKWTTNYIQALAVMTVLYLLVAMTLRGK